MAKLNRLKKKHLNNLLKAKLPWPNIMIEMGVYSTSGLQKLCCYATKATLTHLEFEILDCVTQREKIKHKETTMSETIKSLSIKVQALLDALTPLLESYYQTGYTKASSKEAYFLIKEIKVNTSNTKASVQPDGQPASSSPPLA